MFPGIFLSVTTVDNKQYWRYRDGRGSRLNMDLNVATGIVFKPTNFMDLASPSSWIVMTFASMLIPAVSSLSL